jgi:hypothetical protein
MNPNRTWRHRRARLAHILSVPSNDIKAHMQDRKHSFSQLLLFLVCSRVSTSALDALLAVAVVLLSSGRLRCALVRVRGLAPLSGSA